MIRCSACTLNWKVDKMKALDKRTKKCWHCVVPSVQKLGRSTLPPKKDGGRELFNIEDAVLAEKMNFSEYAYNYGYKLFRKV